MSHIKTYARIRPTRNSYDDFEVTPNRVYIRVPEHVTSASIWAGKSGQRNVVNHEFKFDHVFREHAPQKEVFDKVAVSVIQGFLSGYNGTIFAYGQTGSGKTFTVEGGAQRYEDRGLAPRALSMIYQALEARTEEEIQVKVSYMEIYQEIGYDLLNTAARTSSVVTPFPKVAVVEGSKGSCIIRNLSMHLAANEDVAQNLLFQGQANRKVAETPMNQRSSRSHAVFTIYLTAKQPGSDIIVKSKLHLVDLAGSERVSKTGTIGLQLNEAKFINLSLHYLEGVIIALQQEANGGQPNRQARPFSSTSVDCRLYNRDKIHKSLRYSPYGNSAFRWVSGQRPSTATGFANPKYVPYRNSLLTMVLRDSLGGNCETAMVATVSMETVNLHESLSTCRFAQRVACITNTLRKNEEIDDKSMIRRLRKRIVELETQLCALREGQNPEEVSLADWSSESKLTDEDKLECARIVEAYLTGRLKDPVMAGITNPGKFRECLQLLRRVVKETEPTRPSSAPAQRLHPVQEDTERPIVQNAWSEAPHNTDQTLPTKQASAQMRNTSYSSLNTESTVTCNPFMPPSGNELGSQVSVQTASTVLDRYMASQNGADSRPNSGSTLRSEAIGEFPENIEAKNSNKYDPRNLQQQQSATKTHPYRNGNGHAKTMAFGAPGKNPGASLPGSVSGSRASLKSNTSRGSLRGSRRSLASNIQPVTSGPVNGRASGYKSPFEKAREREIRQLDKKVERKSEAILEQEQDIRSMQDDIRYQKLVLLRNEISGKLNKTQQQLKEQQLFISRLQDANSAATILQQEALVEKQLLKRQHKMQARLKVLEEQMNQEKMKQGNQQKEDGNTDGVNSGKMNEPKVKPQTNMATKGGAPAKVNSRAVLEKLQKQEKQQKKTASRLEKEHVLTLSEHVQVKEAATRQKLQLFREKLRMAGSQSQSTVSNASVTSEPSTTHPEADHFNPFIDIKPPVFDMSSTGESRVPDPFSPATNSISAAPKENEHKLRNGSTMSRDKDPFESSQFESVASGHTSHPMETKNEKQKSSALKAGPNDDNTQQKSHLSSSSSSSLSKLLTTGPQSSANANSTALLQQLLEKHKSSGTHSQKASKAWDSGYSREPSRPQTQESINMGSASSFTQGHNNQIQFTSSVLQAEGYEDLPRFDWLRVDHESTNDHRGTGADSVLTANKELLPGYFSKTSQNSNGSGTNLSVKSFGLESKPNNQTSPTNISGSAVSFESQNETDSSKLSHMNQTHALVPNPQSRPDHPKTQTDIAMNRNQENQDYKPRPSSQSDFDAALKKMLLGNDNAPTSITTATQKDYDIFARDKPERSKPKSLPVQNVYRTATKPNPKDTRASRGSVMSGKGPMKTPMAAKTQPAKNVRLWGPEAKFMSVSDRLRDFQTVDSPYSSGKSKDDTSLNLKKPTRITEESTDGLSGEWKRNLTKSKAKPEIDLDKYKIKIRALNDDNREETYTSTVKQQRDRVTRIRQARGAAETIQKAWRNYQRKLLKRK